jgi:hypothetical protein
MFERSLVAVFAERQSWFVSGQARSEQYISGEYSLFPIMAYIFVRMKRIWIH